MGEDGIDYRATGLKIHFRTEATPGSDATTIFYRVRVDVDGCYSFLDAFVRGTSSGPLDPPDKSIEWNKREDGCPYQSESTNPGWTATIGHAAKELVMTLRYDTLSATELGFLDEGSILGSSVANTRTYVGAFFVGTDFTAQFDESPMGTNFEVGSDMPTDLRCTTGCP